MNYQIKVKGHLNISCSDRFYGMAMKLDNKDETVLSGDVKDQVALHGLLKQLRDLGIPLISINPIY
ncbi:MAG: hypothetical protein OCD02_10270 [Spirochaetaceae bacterium]